MELTASSCLPTNSFIVVKKSKEGLKGKKIRKYKLYRIAEWNRNIKKTEGFNLRCKEKGITSQFHFMMLYYTLSETFVLLQSAAKTLLLPPFVVPGVSQGGDVGILCLVFFMDFRSLVVSIMHWLFPLNFLHQHCLLKVCEMDYWCSSVD